MIYPFHTHLGLSPTPAQYFSLNWPQKILIQVFKDMLAFNLNFTQPTNNTRVFIIFNGVLQIGNNIVQQTGKEVFFFFFSFPFLFNPTSLEMYVIWFHFHRSIDINTGVSPFSTTNVFEIFWEPFTICTLYVP